MYSKIEIFGNVDVDYLHVKSSVLPNEISEFNGTAIQKPSWDNDTIMLATYDKSEDGNVQINATPLEYSSAGNLVGYQIQKYDIKNDIMSYVTQTNNTCIQDYKLKDGEECQYYIFPIIESKNDPKMRTLGSPIVTDAITTDWELCTIIGLVETDKRNEYTVDKTNIWRLQLNVEMDDYVLNTDKNFSDGFDRFSKRTQGIKKYVTGGINSIVGMLECGSAPFKVSGFDFERWEEFCYSPNLKLFNDMRGRLLPVDIESVSTGYLYKGEDSPVVANIKFRQMEDINNISVYGVGGE